MSLERISKAANAAACDTLGQLGPSLVNLGVWTMWTPKVGLTALTLGAASNLAYQYSCAEQDAGVSPSGTDWKGCKQLSSGKGDLRVYEADGTFVTTYGSDITGYDLRKKEVAGDNIFYDIYLQYEIGGPYEFSAKYGISPGNYFEMFLQTYAVCGEDVPDTPATPPEVEPYEYTDESGCKLIVNFQGFVQESEGGNVQPVYLIEGAPYTDTRAGGGRIGGCFFEPTIYYGGANGGGDGGCGGGTTIPLPPGGDPGPGPDGDPWWLDVLQGILGGLAALLSEKAFDAIFDEELPGTTYRLQSVCETNDKGEPIDKAVEVVIPPLTQPDSQIARLDAIVALLQGQKDFKQPICVPEPEPTPEPEGNFRTISFRSESTSPYGKSRLRKRFRYRSTSGLGLGEIVDYWKDFTFQSGPYRVRHTGSSWGTLEVWAATEDEGKRVIRHAAGEAGIDPDQVGRWSTRRSDSSRLGVSDTMRVDTTGGYFWITSRDGSDNRPVVASSPDQ